ncbi:hypothetical protein DL546_002383 [Coniochaeta pulveracea]|nr:hypothetical protein DL546_002383 [Coniochaeta pulveracea]
MRPPVLVFFILVSLTLVAVIEYLAQESHKQGGLFLAPNANEPSTGIIATRYVPTVVAVVYSLAWTWIDLDIRRIQPWLEMSRRDGGTAEATLLLDYPFEFLAFLPFSAAKRKHWLVFLGGTVMMLIFWAVTPLQGAIFGTQAVTVTQQVAAAVTARLMPLDRQLDSFDASIPNTAYSITWLKQPFPEFTTANYAYIPFRPSSSSHQIMPNETWTAETTALSTHLDCWPAVVTKTDTPFEYTFDNGRGCTADLTPTTKRVSANSSNIVYTILYIGYHMDPTSDWFLENPNCSQAASHQFLAIWKSSASEDMTSLFCETSYTKQKAQVSVSALEKRPEEDTLLLIGDAEPLLETEFNSTAFEYLIGTGVPPKQYRRDYANDKIVRQDVAMINRGVNWPATNMVGFGIGPSTYSLEELKNATNLQSIFASAHRRIFSAAVPKVLQGNDTRDLTRSAAVQYLKYGVVVSRPLALVVEILLLVIAVLVSLVLIISHRTYSSLSKDPASIGDNLAVLRESKPLLQELIHSDQYDDKTLQKILDGHRFKLVERHNAHGPALGIDILKSASSGSRQPLSPKAVNPAVHHRAMRPLSGMVFVFTLLAGIGILLYFKRKEASLGGLPRPTENFEVLQLIENYIPTVFATLLEPFLVLLNRLRCLLQPFHTLRKGNATASKTLETSYTSIPPQLVIWRAFRAGHIILGSLCAMTLLANVLAVALGALFNENPVMVQYPVTFQQVQTAKLNSSNSLDPSDTVTYYFDPFYVTMANLSSGTPLPPWIDSEFAYFPFVTTDGNRDNSSLTYQAHTQGFGVDTVCKPLSTSPNNLPYVDYHLHDDASQSLAVLYENENGSITNCTNPWFWKTPALDINQDAPAGGLAQELATQLQPQKIIDGNTYQNPNDHGFCERRMLMSWFRVQPRERNKTLEALHLDCVSSLQTATFNVTVNSAGYVVDAVRVGPLGNLRNMDRNETQRMLGSANDIIAGGAGVYTDSAYTSLDDAGWHNDTLTRDWMNYLIKLMLNSTKLVDPDQPLPTAEETIPVVQDLYKRLFSVALGLNMRVFKTAAEPVPLLGTVVVPETRIFMDDTAFIITIVILGLNVVVAVVVYVQEGRPFLPRLPSTIGSLAAYVAASRAVREYVSPETDDTEGRRHGGGQRTYGFGRFMGVDGREHVGVEMDPYVQPGEGGGRTWSSVSLRLRKLPSGR